LWLLPVIGENIAAGRDLTLSAAVVASWARSAEGVDEQGKPINVVDRLADTLQRLAAQQREDPLAFVKNRELFGDLATEPAFTEPDRNTLNSLHTNGARATLQTLAARSSPV
jgi:mannitol 2-dehydrogenase